MLKKTIYTLKVECNKEFADRVEYEWGDEDEIDYYKKINIDGLVLSDLPVMVMYTKRVPRDSDNDSWEDNAWEFDGLNHSKVEDGKVWVRYASGEVGEDEFRCGVISDYKIVVIN
jgi:hypothetical protein